MCKTAWADHLPVGEAACSDNARRRASNRQREDTDPGSPESERSPVSSRRGSTQSSPVSRRNSGRTSPSSRRGSARESPVERRPSRRVSRTSRAQSIQEEDEDEIYG
jgi:hypothetical protein